MTIIKSLAVHSQFRKVNFRKVEFYKPFVIYQLRFFMIFKKLSQLFFPRRSFMRDIIFIYVGNVGIIVGKYIPTISFRAKNNYILAKYWINIFSVSHPTFFYSFIYRLWTVV